MAIDRKMPVEEEAEEAAIVETEEGAAEAETEEMAAEGADEMVDTPDGPGRKATPEQEAQFETFVDLAYQLIYGGGTPEAREVTPAVLKQLSAGNDPVHALAMAAVTTVMRVLDDATQKGVKVDHAVLLVFGKEIYQELADLSAKAGIHEFEQVEIDNGWVQAMDLARGQMEKRGMIDKGVMQRNIDEMKRAEAEGRLDDVLPGLGDFEEKFAAAKAKGPPAPAEEKETGGLL